MKILICEFMDARAVERLRSRHEVVYDPTLVDDAARLRAACAGVHALVVRNRTQVRGELLAALDQCRVVGRLGVGLDNIDLPGCEARGMRVIPATGANALSVAEYVVTAALVLRRGAWMATPSVAAGQWPRNGLSNGREIGGRTLGLIGFGGIGQLTAGLARGLGMRVIAFDAMMDADHPVFADGAVACVGLDELVQTADVVSLHVPLVDGTRGLFDAARIAAMKPGAVLVNTARGGIVDEAALAAALKSGHLGGAALDVFNDEPLPLSPHFEHCPNLLLTPHVAGVTAESNQRVSFLIADKLIEALGADA
ncbi:MAG: hydroxyacid dehydrogenase [Rubrivivax sp.]|nr:hydroxyacid dehydrogenase [Rubrivivax sp.]